MLHVPEVGGRRTGMTWPWPGSTTIVAVPEQVSDGQRQPETVGQNCRTGQIDDPVRQAWPVDTVMKLIVLPLYSNLLNAGH